MKPVPFPHLYRLVRAVTAVMLTILTVMCHAQGCWRGGESLNHKTVSHLYESEVGYIENPSGVLSAACHGAFAHSVSYIRVRNISSDTLLVWFDKNKERSIVESYYSKLKPYHSGNIQILWETNMEFTSAIFDLFFIKIMPGKEVMLVFPSLPYEYASILHGKLRAGEVSYLLTQNVPGRKSTLKRLVMPILDNISYELPLMIIEHTQVLPALLDSNIQ